MESGSCAKVAVVMETVKNGEQRSLVVVNDNYNYDSYGCTM